MNFLTDLIQVIVASALLRLLLLWLHLLQWLLRFRCLGSGRKRAVCCFLFFPSPISLLLPRQPFLSRALPARLLWLLARLVDGLAPSACVVRCPQGSTMRFSTMSCVFSTHRFLHALNSLPSLLQRIPLALSSLLRSWASNSLS